jgi:PAS domain S-box-containing protein
MHFRTEASPITRGGLLAKHPAIQTETLETNCRIAMETQSTAELTIHDRAQDRLYEVTVSYVLPGLFLCFRDTTAHVCVSRALRESERHLQIMADSIPQMVWIVEASGKTVYFNHQWAAYTGVPIDGSTPAAVVAEFVHPDDREATLSAWEAAYGHGTAFHVEHRIRSQAGDYRWFLELAEPYRNAAGDIERWFGTSTDIHEQKMAKLVLTESELRFRALVNATSDVVYRMSPDWKFMHQLDGRGFLKTTEGLGEYKIDEYVHAQDRALARATIDEAIRSKTIFALEHRVVRVDGSLGWTYSRAVPILDAAGEILEWIGMASDITARKAVEEERQQANERKDEFLAMLAHELRNPLAPIASAADMLKILVHDDARIRKASDIISRQTRHLAMLVDDLLDVSRVTRGLIELDKRVITLDTVIESAIEQSRPLLESRQHALSVSIKPPHPSVYADRNRLIQVVANLLNNAAKYTPQGGEIAVAIRIDGARALIEVSDNGIGIEPALLPHVFDLFTQATRTPDRSHGGLGIGLALVHAIVKLHGGAITVASAGLGKGSTFTLSLPITGPD